LAYPSRQRGGDPLAITAGTTEITMQRILATVLIATTTIVLTLAASAGSNVEDGDVYEAKYLAACSTHLPPASCQCTMEVIEDTLSFDTFVSLVEHFGGNIRRALPPDRVDPAIEQRCGIAGLSTSQKTNVTQRARAPE
jgi:hypothetical protein